MSIFRTLAVALLWVALGVNAASAQDFPSRPIKIIVPFGAGGLADILVRAATEHMRATLKQPIIIENEPGAGGAMGAAAGARAAPDGYTITLIGNPTVALMETTLNPGFDVLKDFAPVGRVTDWLNLFLVNPKVSANSISELVAYAKANPGKLNLGSNTTASDMVLKVFAKKHDIEFALVSYRTGPDVVRALMSGEIDASLMQAGSVMSQIQDNLLKPLAIVAPYRWEGLPNVPNADEAGTRFYLASWIGLVAPAATPPDRIAILNRALVAALNQPDMKALATKSGAAVRPGPPAEMTETIRTDWANTKEAVTISGVQKQ